MALHNYKRTSGICLRLLIPLLLLAACAPTAAATPTVSPTTAPATATPEPSPTSEPSVTLAPSATRTLSPTATPDLRLKPEDWQEWPILPELSPAMLAVFEEGQALGRDPHVFSVIGDCQSSPTYFLAMYDEGRYTLTEDQEDLQAAIDWYSGSFAHRSVTVKNGMTAPGALNPRWSDPEACETTENPIECEIRLSNPSLALISLGTNWLPSASYEQYLAYLNQVVDILLEQGIIPVLSTKADNAEGDYNRNLAMAQLAYDRQLPLWNFWATVKDLPNLGLDKDRENVYLNDKGWDARNLSALQLLESLRQDLDLH